MALLTRAGSVVRGLISGSVSVALMLSWLAIRPPGTRHPKPHFSPLATAACAVPPVSALAPPEAQDARLTTRARAARAAPARPRRMPPITSDWGGVGGA